MNIIQWCNSNQGFINAILASATLMISVVAIYISIRIAYIPYKKNIIINSVTGIKDNKYYLELTIANSGNRIIGVNYIDAYYRKTYIGSCCENKFIEPSKMENFLIDLDLSENDIKFDKNVQIKIEVCDTERKKYKFVLGLAMG